ncbi:hypothetical protein DSECCO2_452710 [anaerobic digester metagenome]
MMSVSIDTDVTPEGKVSFNSSKRFLKSSKLSSTSFWLISILKETITALTLFIVVDVQVSKPFVCRTTSSNFLVTSSSISSADAPGYTTLTEATGNTTSGKCCFGIDI